MKFCIVSAIYFALLITDTSAVLSRENGSSYFKDWRDWTKTDFSRHVVDLHNIVDAGPGKDGFRSLDSPQFEFAEGIRWLDPREPLAVLRINGEVRAYPLQILMYHEIVNDVLAGVPIALTYCPLCNAVIVLQRELQGKILEFGTAGKVIDSNMIMYDRQTESWWQQFTGEAVVGAYTGSQLQSWPSQIVSFEQLRTHYPMAAVLSRQTGFDRRYGINPYEEYDSRRLPWRSFYQKPVDPRLPAMQRVLGIVIDDTKVAIPFFKFNKTPVLETVVSDVHLLVITQSGLASPVDRAKIRESRNMLAAAAFNREVNGQRLNFEWSGDELRDIQTRSLWNIFGQAIQGPLKGAQLQQVDNGVYFAFVWFNFFPDSRLYK